MARLHAFFNELRRRNVLRAAAVYGAGVWAFGQGLSQFSPALGLPDWTTRWFLVAAFIGFPVWVAFAWFYEFTPSGLKRESEIAPDDSIAHSTGRKLDFWIIGILCVAVVLLLTDRFVVHKDANAIVAIPEKSIAVLPLANESGDPKQQYFSDGLSEELISDLAQINGLKVIGKYSSFNFRDSKDSPAQIGATLGVAHLLQGSVRQIGDHLRVMVTLIATRDGAVVWSHTYDQQLKDVFAIQTQIGQAVAAALKIKLLGQTLGIDDKPPSGNVEAYKLMLQGRAINRRAGSAKEFRQAIALYQQALKLDPNYADAWGALSNAWINLVVYLPGDAQQQAYAQARVAVDKEQALAPDAAATHMDRGYLMGKVDHDPKGALAEFQRAYALAPNDGTVMAFLANGYAGIGQLQPAVELYRKAIATDPLRPDFYGNLGSALVSQGRLDAAEQATRKALALQPDYAGLYLNLAEIDILRGDAVAAQRDAKQEADPVYGPQVQALALQIGPDRKQADAALHAYIARNGKDQPSVVADLYALRKQPDDMFEWLQRAWMQRDPSFNLTNDPFVLAYKHDPRFAALCKQAGLPLPADASPDSASAASGTPSSATSSAPASKP